MCVFDMDVYVITVVRMDPDNSEIRKDAERSRKKLLTLVKKQEILLRGKEYSTSYFYLHILC